MTAGTSGTSWPVIFVDTYGHQKRWSGTDGKTISGRVSRKSKWNAYEIGYRRIIGGGVNRITIWNPMYSPPLYPGPEVRVNHSWSSVAGMSSGFVPLTFPQALFDASWTNQEEYKLLAKIRNKVNGHSFNMGVSLAEVDKLAGTVNSTLRTLSYGVVDLLTGNFGRFARRLGTSPPSPKAVRRLKATDVSGRFLEMRYAWEPVINDVYESAKAFEALSNGPRQQTFRSAVRKVTMVPFVTNYCGGRSFRRTVSKQYLFEMYEEMDAFRQMGLGNPLSIVWERIPYSFVVDWFLPIGTYLELIGQIPFMKGRWCRTSKFLEEYSGIAGDYGLSWSIVAFPSADIRRLNMKREISFSPPSVPRPNLKVQGAVQGKRLQNAVSLAHQIFARAALVPFSKRSGYSKRDLRRPVSEIHESLIRLDEVISFSKPIGK